MRQAETVQQKLPHGCCMGTRMLLSGREMQLQAGTEAQAAQLSMNPSHCHHSQAEGESQSTFTAQQCPTGGFALFQHTCSMAGTSVPYLHLGSTLRHILGSLGVSCAGVEHDDPCESLPAQDIPWQSFAKNSFFNLFGLVCEKYTTGHWRWRCIQIART